MEIIFQCEVIRLCKHHIIDVGDRKYYNMDETPLSSNTPVHHIVSKKGGKYTFIKNVRTRERPFHCCPGLHGSWYQVEANGDL